MDFEARATEALLYFSDINTNAVKFTRNTTKRNLLCLKIQLNTTHLYSHGPNCLTLVEIVFRECLELSFSVIYRLSRTMAAEMRQSEAPTMHRAGASPPLCSKIHLFKSL